MRFRGSHRHSWAVGIGHPLVSSDPLRSFLPGSLKRQGFLLVLGRPHIDVFFMESGQASHGRFVAFSRFLHGSMFLDFDSLHQKPRVGGTHGRVRRDGSDCWRSNLLSSPADRSVHRDRSFFLHIVTGSFVFWDFGSLYLKESRRPSGQLFRQRQSISTNCGVHAADCCGSGSLSLTYGPTSRGQRFRQRHQRNDVSAFLKPAVPEEAFGKSKSFAHPWPTVAAAVFPCGQ